MSKAYQEPAEAAPGIFSLTSNNPEPSIILEVDTDYFIINYILLGMLLFLSFYFSGSEAAIFSLNRLERNALRETKSGKKNRIISYLLNHQEQLLISILTGNMIVNIFASSIGSIVGDRIFAGNSEIISIAGMTVLLLLMGELTPKRIAVNHSKAFTRVTAATLFYIHNGLTPVRFLLNHVSEYILALFPNDLGGEAYDRNALVSSTVELGYNQEILHKSEYGLLKSYLSFKKKCASSVMTPRSELHTVPWDMTVKDVHDLIGEERTLIMNSTILLHKGDYDNLTGWVPVASILSAVLEEGGDRKIKTMAREFQIIPESKKLPELISEMRESDSTLVLVLDEYGGTAGMLWFKNLLEDLMKTYYNPFGKSVIAGSLAMEDLRDMVHMEIPTDAVTAAGFFLEIYGSMPVPGDEIHYRGMGMAVSEMEGNRIKSMRIKADVSP